MTLNRNFVLREIAGEHMLVPIGEQTAVTDGIITLSPVAARIWCALDRGADRAGCLAAVLEVYEIDEQTAAQDLDEFLASMTKAGLLEDI